MPVPEPKAAIVGLIAAWLLVICGCSGGAGDGDGDRSATSVTSEPAAGDQEARATDPSTSTTSLPDTLIGRYAEAVVAATTSDAAIGGSPAAVYLDYLANYTELTGRPVGHIAEIDDDSFRLAQTAALDVVYDRFEQSDLGISDLSMDGRPLHDIVSVVRRPIRDPSGIEVLGGYAFTSYGPNRVAIITLRNGTDTALTIDPASASWIEVDGRRQPAEPAGVGEAVELGSGATADVITTFPRGDGAPDGVLEQVITPSGTGERAEVMLAIPLGRGRPTFFTSAADGTLQGELDADIAFATDSAEPSVDALDILFKATQEILVHDRTSALCVSGHADSVGAEAHNLELSQDRALAVAAVLADYGVTNPIEAVGYGEAFAPGDELDDPASRRVGVSFADCPPPPNGE